MIRLHRVTRLATACIAALALAACGPGGPKRDDSAGNSNSIPATGVPTGSAVTVPTLTNNVAVDGRAWINYRRALVGMSVLAQNKQIDIAAQGHSDYQRINNTVTHEQTKGLQGFTGVTLQDRLAAANYRITGNNAIGEVISATSNGSGFYMAEQLITAVYHRFVIFEPIFKEVGSGSASTSSGYTYFTADFAASNGYGPGLASGVVATWPINGQTDVPASFNSDQEEPDPAPNNGVVGYPVSVHANLTSRIAVTSFTIRAHGASADLSTRLLSQATDSNTTTASAVAIVPLAALAAGTTYDVSFSGSVDGIPINKTWSFTTAK